MSKKQRNKVNNAQKAKSEIGGWYPYTHVHTQYIIQKHTCNTHTPHTIQKS